MAYAIGNLITFGIGTPSEIAPLMLFGLAPIQASTSVSFADLPVSGMRFIRGEVHPKKHET